MRTFLLAVAAALFIATPAEAAPQWLAPVDVESGLSAQVDGALAVASNGATMSAWIANVGGANVARARVRLPGQGYGPTIDLTPAAGFDAQNARVGVDEQGNFTVAWDEDTVPASTRVVKAARMPAGGAFEPTETVGPGASPELSVGGGGTAVIAFQQGTALRAAVRPGAGGEFEDATTLVGTAITGAPGVGVDDAGNAVVVWSREVVAGSIQVAAAERAPGGAFPAVPLTLSSTTPGDKATQPALAVAPGGGAVVLWTFQEGAGVFRVQAVQRTAPGTWTAPETASKPGDAAFDPRVAIAADGTAIGGWRADLAGVNVLQVAARPPGGPFGGFRYITSAAIGTFAVASNRAGASVIAWNGPMAEGVFAVRRPAGGDFGSVDTVALGTQGTATPAISLNFEDVGIDDQSNAVAEWGRATNPGGIFTYSLQTASFDAAPPSLDAVSVPATGTPRAAIGMAATASDRLSVPSITWSFGDGATATGPAVSHAYAAAGAYTVTVTATDAAGSTTSATRAVSIDRGARPRRIDSSVSTRWAFNKRRVFLLRMRVNAPPRRAKAELRCGGKKCPFKRRKVGKIRKNALTVFKNMKATKAVKKKIRRFRPKQTLQLRITAPGFTGKVVKYRIKRGKIPVGKVLCLPEGKKKPRKCGR